MGSHYYINDPESETGHLPVPEDEYIQAIFRIAEESGLKISDKEILKEIKQSSKKPVENSKSKTNQEQEVIYAFIDSQNTHLGVLDGHNWKLDFAKFQIYLRDKYKVRKALLFIGYVAGNEKLYTSLQEAGYVVIFKPTLEYKKDGKIKVKGNVDAELVLHTMIEFDNFDKAIIVFGDGDFHCLVEYLVDKEKFFKLIIPNRYGFSALLRKFRRYFVYLDQLRSKLEYKSEKNKKRGSNLRTKP